jgi:hypothetical protein
MDVVSCPLNQPSSPWSQLRMKFVEALRLILARGIDPIIVRRDLKGRGPSASDYPR